MQKLLILAAGRGSRMLNLGNDFNKGLLPVAGKAIITHIIENADVDEIIIAVGYKSEQVKEYCQALHSKSTIKFVDVDNYDGPGSGPGYSMYCCKELLDCPFYLLTADSLIKEKLPPIDYNWIGIATVPDIENYATCSIDSQGRIIDFKNKSKDSLSFAFTGVAAIYDYKLFWEKFDSYKENKSDKETELVGAFYKPFFADIYGKELEWHDTGRKDLYQEIYLKDKGIGFYDLKKIDIDEFTYCVNNVVAKITTEKKAEYKKRRGLLLTSLTPQLKYTELKNFVVHDFVDGKTLYEIDSTDLYKSFLHWCSEKLFVRKAGQFYDFADSCLSFYKTRTIDRLVNFQKKTNLNFVNRINNLDCKSPLEILNKINWENVLASSQNITFHGDLNFGNVICKPDQSFCLIDWRSDFDGNMSGDLYYDLSKLYAGTAVNFALAHDSQELFLEKESAIVLKEFETKATLEFKLYYENWLVENVYDLTKVKLIAALIYLNMSPLHSDKFGKYLFYKGTYELCKII